MPCHAKWNEIDVLCFLFIKFPRDAYISAGKHFVILASLTP